MIRNNRRNFFYQSIIGTTIAAIEANNDIYCLQKNEEKSSNCKEFKAELNPFQNHLLPKMKLPIVQNIWEGIGHIY